MSQEQSRAVTLGTGSARLSPGDRDCCRPTVPREWRGGLGVLLPAGEHPGQAGTEGHPRPCPTGEGVVEQTPQLSDLVPPPFLLGLRSISPFSNRHQQLSQRNNPACAHSHQLCPDPAQAADAGTIWDTTATSCHRQG